MKIIDQCYKNYPWGKIVPTLPMQLLMISYCFKLWNSNSKDSFVTEKIPKELQHPLTSKPKCCKGYFLWGDAAQWLLERMAILIQNNALYYLSKYSLRSITRNSSFSFRVCELSGIYKTEGMCYSTCNPAYSVSYFKWIYKYLAPETNKDITQLQVCK